MIENGKKIQTARLERNMTQQALGEALGYEGVKAQVYVALWETGKKPVPRKKLKAISKILGVDISELL